MLRHDTREDAVGSCADCEQDVGLEDSHAFTLPDGGLLCWACALIRGGVYDDKYDRWVVSPAAEDLPDERRPHA